MRLGMGMLALLNCWRSTGCTKKKAPLSKVSRQWEVSTVVMEVADIAPGRPPVPIGRMPREGLGEEVSRLGKG